MPTAQQLVEQAKQTITEISASEAAKKLQQDPAIRVIDVREPDEFGQGHINKAMNIPRGVLEFQIGDHISDSNTPIVVYCKTGGRAALSAQALQTLGYTQVKSIAGGYEGWVADGQTTVTPHDTKFY